MADLVSIPMMTPQHESMLRRLDIKSTDTLLFGVNSAQDLQTLSTMSGIDALTLKRFIAFSEILRLPGVGTSLGRNLYDSGLTSVGAIARMQAGELVQHMHRTRDVALSNRKAEQIVTAARAMRQRFEDQPSVHASVMISQTLPIASAAALGDE
jgi:hypothetical protein